MGECWDHVGVLRAISGPLLVNSRPKSIENDHLMLHDLIPKPYPRQISRIVLLSDYTMSYLREYFQPIAAHRTSSHLFFASLEMIAYQTMSANIILTMSLQNATFSRSRLTNSLTEFYNSAGCISKTQKQFTTVRSCRIGSENRLHLSRKNGSDN